MRNKFILLFYVLISFSKAATSQQLMDIIINVDSIHSIIETLSSDSLNGRLTGTAENSKAATIIAKKFQEIGLKQVQGLNGYFETIDSIGSNV